MLVNIGATAASANSTHTGYPQCTIRGSGVVIGTQNNDVICGSGGNDTLIGLGGNDTLIGFGGDDRMYGGRGYDYLYGNDGNDWLFDTDAVVEDGGSGWDACIGSGNVSFQQCEFARNLGARFSGLSIIVSQRP
jgi:Ca2+-binding RTX toxin-like protein